MIDWRPVLLLHDFKICVSLQKVYLLTFHCQGRRNKLELTLFFICWEALLGFCFPLWTFWICITTKTTIYYQEIIYRSLLNICLRDQVFKHWNRLRKHDCDSFKTPCKWKTAKPGFVVLGFLKCPEHHILGTVALEILSLLVLFVTRSTQRLHLVSNYRILIGGTCNKDWLQEETASFSWEISVSY